MESVVKWIDAKQKPQKSGDYLVYTSFGAVMVVGFSKRHNSWNASDLMVELSECYAELWDEYVLFWAEVNLPEVES